MSSGPSENVCNCLRVEVWVIEVLAGVVNVFSLLVASSKCNLSLFIIVFSVEFTIMAQLLCYKDRIVIPTGLS